jgi:hypothetical protein
MAHYVFAEWKITLLWYRNSRGAIRYKVSVTNLEQARPTSIELSPFILPQDAVHAANALIVELLDRDVGQVSRENTAGG